LILCVGNLCLCLLDGFIICQQLSNLPEALLKAQNSQFHFLKTIECCGLAHIIKIASLACNNSRCTMWLGLPELYTAPES
jgi:hypothetical protein